VEWDGSGATVRVPELLVRATLPDLREAVGLQQSDDFPRSQDGNGAHSSGDLDSTHIDELGLEIRLAILEEHFDDLSEILLKLIDVGALRVGTGPSGHIPDQDAGFWIALNNELEGSHRSSLRADQSA
jgi:hypothetical protein